MWHAPVVVGVRVLDVLPDGHLVPLVASPHSFQVQVGPPHQLGPKLPALPLGTLHVPHLPAPLDLCGAARAGEPCLGRLGVPLLEPNGAAGAAICRAALGRSSWQSGAVRWGCAGRTCAHSRCHPVERPDHAHALAAAPNPAEVPQVGRSTLLRVLVRTVAPPPQTGTPHACSCSSSSTGRC